MLSRFSLLLFALILSTQPAGAQTRPTSAHPIVASNLSVLEAWLSANAAYQQQPGFSVAIVHDQNVVFAKAFGYANVRRRLPFQTDTIVRIGSQSKLFTTIAIMQLCEAGKISIDDQVVKHLPSLRIRSEGAIGSPITIKQLLTHTAGLLSDGTSTHHWTDLDFTTSDQINAEMAALDVVAKPTSKRKYSNLGYAIAGRLIEEVSGMPFDKYVQSRILTPLNMGSTHVRSVPKSSASRMATGYGRRMPNGSRASIEEWNARSMTPAFGMRSTLDDLTTFVKWQIRLADATESDILAPATIREMRKRTGLTTIGPAVGGLAFRVSKLEDRTVYGLYGSVPGYFSSTYVDADQKLGVIVVTNSMDAQPYLGQPLSIPERVFAIIGPAVERAERGDSVPDQEEVWTKYYGTYRSIWNDSVVLNYEGQLSLFDPTASDPVAAIFKLKPVANNAHRFILESGPDAQLVDEQMQFTFASDDDVASEMELIGLGRSKQHKIDAEQRDARELPIARELNGWSHDVNRVILVVLSQGHSLCKRT